MSRPNARAHGVVVYVHAGFRLARPRLAGALAEL